MNHYLKVERFICLHPKDNLHYMVDDVVIKVFVPFVSSTILVNYIFIF